MATGAQPVADVVTRAVPDVAGAKPSRGYIRSRTFDATLLLAPSATGLGAGAVVAGSPFLFPVFLFADLWLLGYHHVVATYTRLAFDLTSLRRNRFLAVDALLVVVALTVLVAFAVGPWAIATAFLYLQWFHYMRQSYGLARMYFRATPAGRAPEARDLTVDLVIYLVAIYGIAARSATMGDEFLNLPVKVLVLPAPIVTALGVAAAAATVVWTARVAQAAARGAIEPYYAGFVLSHIAVFLTAYVVIDDANIGWLAINAWHNLQYVLVVWMTNAKRYAGGIDREARLLSAISQPGRVGSYFACCFAISTALYVSLDGLNTLMLGGGLAMTTGLYMGINFHHYVVDALIWKRGRVAVPARAA